MSQTSSSTSNSDGGPGLKRLLLSVFALAAPFLFFLGIFDYRLFQVRTTQMAAKRYLFQARKREVKVLILGSSHSLRGILPSCLGQPAFNLSGASQTLYYDRALLNKCVRHMPSLELVILPVSFHSLEVQLDEGIDAWLCYYYFYEWWLPHRDWHMALHVRNFSGYFLCGETLGYQNMLLGKINDVTADFDSWGGWTNRPAEPEASTDSTAVTRLRQSAQAALLRHRGEMRQEHLAENERILEDIAQQLARRGIGLALVTLPVSRFYAEGMDAATYQRMQETLTGICAKNQLSYFNYAFDRRFSDQDFYDGDHLNSAGAQKFSRLLKEDVVSRFFGSQARTWRGP